jgi:hypothetical protein
MAPRKPGLDYAYDQARKALLSRLRDGEEACPFCHRPMFKSERLSADHFPPRSVAQRLGVASVLRPCHLKCNVRDGQRLGGEVSAARRRKAWVPKTLDQKAAQKQAIAAVMRKRKAAREGRSIPDPNRW